MNALVGKMRGHAKVRGRVLRVRQVLRGGWRVMPLVWCRRGR